MIRAGVIRNLKSHRNQGGARARLPDGVLEVVPEEPRELSGALARFARDGVDLVVVDGGDGTVREVVSRLPEAYGGRLPRMAVLPNGKTNALALDLGVQPGTALEAVLHGATVKRRPCLEVLRAGETTPEHRGFIFGLGAFVRATELAQRTHGLGFFDNAAIALTFAAVAGRTLAGGPSDPWRRGEPGRVSLAEGDAWFLVFASTLKRLPMGVRPFGVPRDGLKVVTVAAPPRRLIHALSPMLRGQHAAWLTEAGYLRHEPESFEVAFDGQYVLDGEIYPAGQLTVRLGPDVEFVTP